VEVVGCGVEAGLLSVIEPGGLVQDNAGGEVTVFVAVESQRLHKQVVGVGLFEVGLPVLL
jgi:hypothetical protein